jgi:hypothetical protein
VRAPGGSAAGQVGEQRGRAPGRRAGEHLAEKHQENTRRKSIANLDGEGVLENDRGETVLGNSRGDEREITAAIDQALYVPSNRSVNKLALRTRQSWPRTGVSYGGFSIPVRFTRATSKTKKAWQSDVEETLLFFAIALKKPGCHQGIQFVTAWKPRMRVYW